MAFYSGNGGKAVVGAGSDLNVGRYGLNVRARLVENTHSGTSGSTNYENVVTDCDGEVEIPVDTSSFPEAGMGFSHGTKITLKLYLGATGKYHTITNTTVEGLAYTNDPQGDIGRVRVNFKGGAYTAPS